MTQSHAGHLPTITAEFNGTPVTIIERDGQRWLTADQIGLALGYNPANARAGLNNLYGRHTDEFSSADTCVIKLMTQGQMRETRIFSATGCIKLGFFASTPKAKEFRTWASEVLAEQSGRAVSAVPAPEVSTELIAKMWATVDALHQQLDERDEKITRLLADQQQTLMAHSYQVSGLQSQLIASQGKQLRLMGTVQSLHRSREKQGARQTMIQMAREGKTREQIVAATGRTFNHVRQVLFQARAAGTLPPLADAASPQTGLFEGA